MTIVLAVRRDSFLVVATESRMVIGRAKSSGVGRVVERVNDRVRKLSVHTSLPLALAAAGDSFGILTPGEELDQILAEQDGLPSPEQLALAIQQCGRPGRGPPTVVLATAMFRDGSPYLGRLKMIPNKAPDFAYMDSLFFPPTREVAELFREDEGRWWNKGVTLDQVCESLVSAIQRGIEKDQCVSGIGSTCGGPVAVAVVDAYGARFVQDPYER